MANKEVVLVARRWDNPTITVTVTEEGIAIAMPITDFVKSLTAQIGNPAMILTQAGLQKELQIAADVILTEMKAATKQVI